MEGARAKKNTALLVLAACGVTVLISGSFRPTARLGWVGGKTQHGVAAAFRAADVVFPRGGGGEGAIAGGLVELPKLLAARHTDTGVAEHARRIQQLFHVSMDVSHVALTPTMVEKVKAKGLDPAAFKKQHTVLIQNAMMPHETLAYNAVRAHRFGPARAADAAMRQKLLAELDAKKCDPPDLCNVAAMTATNPHVRGGDVSWGGETVFRPPAGPGHGGHLENERAVTFSNMGHNAALHAVIAATKTWNPLRLTERDFEGLFALTRTYFAEAHRADPEARFPSFIFDSLGSAGASQLHPHFQAQLHRRRYTGRWEAWRRAADAYHHAHAGRDYFQDVVGAHAFLGLAFGKSAHFVAYVSLTAAANVEVVVVGDARGVMDTHHGGTEPMHELGRLVHATFRAAYAALPWDGASGACALPPFRGGAGGLPVVCRFVPRGSYYATINDVSANELFENTVAMGDVVVIARALREKMDRRFAVVAEEGEGDGDGDDGGGR